MSKAILFKNKNKEAIYVCPYYPVGSIYKSTSNINPTNFFGGTWNLISSGNERQHVGSEVIFSNLSGYGNVSKTNIIGAYNYETILGLFDNITVPSGFHREYRLTFQGRTGGDNRVKVFLNNIETSAKGTWSAETFRVIGGSAYFKESDLLFETTMGYSGAGLNLKYEVTGSDSNWNIFFISIQGFLVTDDYFYVWKRVS